MSTEKKVTESGNKNEVIQEKVIYKRRKFLAGITTGVAAAGMTSGGKWVKPVVDSVILPVHAQTSGGSNDMKIEARIGRIGDADEFEAYEGIRYTDGNYPITADGGVDYDNFQADFAALFTPEQAQSVSVNLDVTVDGVGGNSFGVDGPLSQTSSANVPAVDAMRASFAPVNVDSDDTTTMTVVGTIRADGYATRRITYVIT